MAKAEVAPELSAKEEPLFTAEVEKPVAAEVDQGAPVSVVDEFHGLGGSYLLDPATGIRTLIERTEPASL